MALFLTAVFTFSAVGCGKEEAKQQDAAVQNEESVETEEKEEKHGYILKDAMITAENGPELTASAAILIEESTGTILYAKNADQKMQIRKCILPA